MPILFQNGRMGRVGYFKFLKIFHHDDFEKSLSKAVEAFKVWACKELLQAGNLKNVFFGPISVLHTSKWF